ncbi:hypothetical protein ACVXZ4_08420 [Lacisediminihabitans sp. FW035]
MTTTTTRGIEFYRPFDRRIHALANLSGFELKHEMTALLTELLPIVSQWLPKVRRRNGDHNGQHREDAESEAGLCLWQVLLAFAGGKNADVENTIPFIHRAIEHALGHFYRGSQAQRVSGLVTAGRNERRIAGIDRAFTAKHGRRPSMEELTAAADADHRSRRQDPRRAGHISQAAVKEWMCTAT